MFLVLIAVGVFGFSGLLSLLAGRNARLAGGLGVTGAFIGCAIGLIPAIRVLATGAVEGFRCGWSIPFGSLAMELDALTAFFLVPILLLSALAALYGSQYMSVYSERKSLGPFWFFYQLLVAGMVTVVVARNGLLFLMAWEIMSLASFFLVTFESEEESVCRAGWTYLVATHIGTAFLLVLFLLLGVKSGAATLDFDRFTTASAQIAPIAGVLFLLAVAGFGTKAGFIPLHVWLPEAHPAAPSHVSALMSGVMIKTGIYGLLRILTLIGAPAPWWGWLLICIGLVSGVLGVLFALAQHDLKRLLAYSSVENIGIISLALGLGILGLSLGNPTLSALGFAGGLLHVINHSLFKGLLFLGAGSVVHATGTREIDRLGGLIKRMPVTAGTFLVGAAAISGLPPLNGFVSEFLIFMGAFGAIGVLSTTSAGVAVIIGLGLIGGLAAACFTKAFGIIFLGAPRGEQADHAHESGHAMRIPMLLLALSCAGIGLFAPLVIRLLVQPIARITGLGAPAVLSQLTSAADSLTAVVLVALLFTSLLLLLMLARWRLLSGRQVVSSGFTWDCGYAAPSARMQYTASSFSQPLMRMFESVLHPRHHLEKPEGHFPVYSSFRTETADLFLHYLFRPVFLGVEWLTLRLRWLQQGRVQIYILYIALTLLTLLVWNLR